MLCYLNAIAYICVLQASVKDDTATKNGQTEERNINFETDRKK